MQKKIGGEKNITMKMELITCNWYLDDPQHNNDAWDCYKENPNTNEKVVKEVGGIGTAAIIHAHHNMNKRSDTNSNNIKQNPKVKQVKSNSITFNIPNDKKPFFLENLYFKSILNIYKNDTLFKTLDIYIRNRSLKINETDFKKNEIIINFDLEGMEIDTNDYLKTPFEQLHTGWDIPNKFNTFVNVKCNTDKYSEKNGYSFKLMVDINEKHQYNIKDRDDMYYFNNNDFIDFIDTNKKPSIIPNLGIKDTIIDFTSNKPYFFTADKSQKFKNLTPEFFFNHFTENNDNIYFNVTNRSIINEPLPSPK